MNDLCWMLERGQRRRALGLLLREEGRWLSSADADRFLSLLVIELRNNLRRRVDALIIKARTLGAI